MLILLLLLFQESDLQEPESVNARLFMESGAIDLIDIRIKGIQPYTFELHTKDESVLVNLFKVARISRKADSRDYEVLFINGDQQTGRIKSMAFTGNPNKKDGKRESYHLFNLDRIHLIQGNQLRACLQGHYEQYTPYPFCPVCGNELVLGPYPEELPEQPPTLPTHRLRLDGRTPSTASRRN